MPNQLRSCAPLAVSSPPWGGGQKKKKKTSGEGCLCTTGSLPSWCLIVSVKEHTHSFLGLVPTPFMLTTKKNREGKERLHTRAAIATPPLRRLRPCLLLLPCRALFADRDGLSTAVSALGRFFA